MVPRWLLLCALALGVLGMHHLGAPGPGHHAAGAPATPVPGAVAADSMAMATGLPEGAAPHTEPGARNPAAHQAAPTPARWSTPLPAGHHGDLGHLCLAILGTALGVGLLLRLLRRHRPARLTPHGPPRTGSTRPRSPPSTSVVLASLCVLRL
ncbi:hypothetical protein LX83_001600 [Goodfellowiella coeruleoviolacea]|uniref:Uncharacterized protein n=1 Tax=Goodfellowiella coeruleoviolacea TaxID=334858 RepID=A0AAE3GC89_9PSEU|nr:hypothetical protein [Goodfellowiella coeruleoviolacea]